MFRKCWFSLVLVGSVWTIVVYMNNILYEDKKVLLIFVSWKFVPRKCNFTLYLFFQLFRLPILLEGLLSTYMVVSSLMRKIEGLYIGRHFANLHNSLFTYNQDWWLFVGRHLANLFGSLFVEVIQENIRSLTKGKLCNIWKISYLMIM